MASSAVSCFTSRSCMLVAAQMLCFVQLSMAGAVYKVLDVNGKWRVHNYFQEGDALSFPQNTHGGADVHEVSSWKEYKACHTSKPLRTFKYGGSDNMEVAAALHSKRNTFYFISADRHMCKSGRRLMVVVHAGSPVVAPSPSIATPPVPAPPPNAIAAPAPITATPVMAPTTESPTPGSILAPPVMAPEPSASPSAVIGSSPVGGPAPTSGPAAAASPPGPPPPPAPTSPPTAPSAAVSLSLPFLVVGILPSLGLLMLS